MNGPRYRSRSTSKPKIHPLERKIKPNPRYEGIEPTINTGNNLRKRVEKLDEIKQYYKFRPDEIFRRITITSLVRLMLEVAKLEIQQIEEDEVFERQSTNILNEDNDDDKKSLSSSDPGSTNESDDRDTISSVVTGGKLICRKQFETNSVADILSQVDISDGRDDETMEKYPFPNRPYLALDVREIPQPETLKTAEAYPHSRLSRAFNFESRSMLHFKNVPGKIIVIVDDDESISAKVATILTQRGYDNVFLLSGGLKVAKIKFPEKLITTPNQRMDEEDIVMIEEFLDEAIARGNSSRLSSYCPSSSRMSRASTVRSRSYQDLSSFRKNVILNKR